MNKLLLGVFIFTVVMMVLFFVASNRNMFQKSPIVQNAPTPTQVVPTIPPVALAITKTSKPDKVIISNVEVKNVFDTPVSKTETNDMVLFENSKYQIVYIAVSNSFIISITASPFESIKKEAESRFLNLLDVNKEGACKINVSITTPRFANPDNAGIVYPLSFCAG